MIAPKHPQQATRLSTLRSYDILDTPRESDFDEIVELASKICNVPISLISLVDDDRQWFKAQVGLGDQETPLNKSVCSHVIITDDFVEIPDMSRDSRTVDNPLCATDPNLRFYAGARLVAPNGMPIGTLCILDDKPRELDDLQRQALRVLSRQVMKQLELRRALRDQEALRGEMDHRVKNSLQTLSSVARLYGRALKEEESVEALNAIQRRIEAVGALHGELQGTNGASKVNSQTYLGRVTALLQESAPANVTISADIAQNDIHPQAASALGMIVSEFVANSIKHGFPDHHSGWVNISVRTSDNGSMLLECSDNGIGSASSHETQPSQVEHLGSDLMSAAASQINGTLHNSLTENGSRLSMQF